MKIAFLTPEYPHPKVSNTAGIGSSIKNLAEALSLKNVEVSIFVYGQQEDDVIFDKRVKLHLIKRRKYHFLGWFLYRKYLQNYINKFVKEENIDLVEAPDWTGITAYMNISCPLIIRLHGSDTYFCKLEKRSQKKKNYWFERIAIGGADHILSVSEFTASKTAEFFKLKRKILVIPNSVDVKSFKPFTNKANSQRLLYFGTLIRKKGVLELPMIFNQIIAKKPEVELVIAGADVQDFKTGESTKDLMFSKFSIEAGKKVKWLGKLSFPEILDELSLAQVILLPSFAEALPMTWLEAMAMEKAMVTSNIGWANELMIDGETGFIENPRNHDAFAKKVVKLLDSPELAQQMGRGAREQVIKKFSKEVVVEKNLQFYKTVRNENIFKE